MKLNSFNYPDGNQFDWVVRMESMKSIQWETNYIDS